MNCRFVSTTEPTDEAVEAAFQEANRRLRLDELSMWDIRQILAAASAADDRSLGQVDR